MAQALLEAFKPPVKSPCQISAVALIPGSGGVFDVHLEGKLIFSKQATGTFPIVEEILAKVQSSLD